MTGGKVVKWCNNCEGDRRCLGVNVTKAYCRKCKSRGGWVPVPAALVAQEIGKVAAFLAWMDEGAPL